MWGESLNRENKDHKRYLKTFICYSVVRLWSFRLCGQVQHCDSTFRLLKTRPDVNSQQHAEILQSWVRIRNTQKGSYQTIHLLINKKHQKLYQNKNPSLKQKSPLKSFFGDRQEKKNHGKQKCHLDENMQWISLNQLYWNLVQIQTTQLDVTIYCRFHTYTHICNSKNI